MRYKFVWLCFQIRMWKLRWCKMENDWRKRRRASKNAPLIHITTSLSLSKCRLSKYRYELRNIRAEPSGRVPFKIINIYLSKWDSHHTISYSFRICCAFRMAMYCLHRYFQMVQHVICLSNVYMRYFNFTNLLYDGYSLITFLHFLKSEKKTSKRIHGEIWLKSNFMWYSPTKVSKW